MRQPSSRQGFEPEEIRPSTLLVLLQELRCMMSTRHPGEIAAGLAALSHAEIARIVRRARRMRAEAIAALFRSAGRGIARGSV